MAKDTNKYFEKYLEFLDKNKLYPSIYTIDGPSCSPEIIINNKKFFWKSEINK